MRLLPILALIFAFASSSQAQSHTSKEGNYSINFPKTPTLKQNTVPLEGGRSTEMFSAMYEASKNKAFFVMYADGLSANFAANLSEDEQVTKIKDAFVKNLNAVITSEKEMTISGHKGLFIKAKGEKVYTHYLFLLVDDRIYQVFIIQRGKDIKDKESKAFFDSFKLNR
jgi:hypothetical protein